MTDLVVTVPSRRWAEWLAEGDLAGEPWTGQAYEFTTWGAPHVEPGERVYVVANGLVRGWAPLLDVVGVRIRTGVATRLIRGGGAVASTPVCLTPERCACYAVWRGPHPTVVVGFRGWRYRWWDLGTEWAFPAWKTAVPVGWDRPLRSTTKTRR